MRGTAIEKRYREPLLDRLEELGDRCEGWTLGLVAEVVVEDADCLNSPILHHVPNACVIEKMAWELSR